MAVCSVLCADGLLPHLVGKGQLLVCSGASYGNGKLGDSIWESHHNSSAQGTRRANTTPLSAKKKRKKLIFGVLPCAKMGSAKISCKNKIIFAPALIC